ncbi:MAG: hypothetical protein ABIO70_29980 [Pseudomonadota bacterium]
MPLLRCPTVAALLFHLGVVMAVSHFAASLELSVNVSRHGTLVQSLLLFLYPVAYAFVGVGAVVEGWLRGGAAARGGTVDGPLRLAGLALLGFLFVALRTDLVGPTTGLVVAASALYGVALASWYTLLGMALARLVATAREGGPGSLGGAWGLHLLGLLAGYAANQWLVAHVGVHAMLVACALTLLVLPRLALPLLAAFLALGALTDLDGGLESLRSSYAGRASLALGNDRRGVLADATGDAEDEVLGGEADVVWRGWSPFSLFMLVERHQGKRRAGYYSGMYNFQFQWDLRDQDLSRRLALLQRSVYSLVQPEDRVVVVGTGGGRGLSLFPIPLHKGIRAVERDGAVIRLLRDLEPELNGGIYQQVDAMAADGRYAIESSGGGWDFIILESARYQPLLALCSASSPYYLYTREAIGGYLDKLAPDGMFAANFNRVGDGGRDNYLPHHVQRSLEAAGAHTAVLSVPRNMAASSERFLFLLASRSQARLDEAVAGVVAWGVDRADPADPRTRVHTEWTPRFEGVVPEWERWDLTDDRPFFGWWYLGPEGRRAMHLESAAVLLLVLLGLLAVAVPRGPPGRVGATAYFALLGVAHTGVQMATFFGFRSFYQDEITTMTRVVIALLAYGALGSWLAGRLVQRGRVPGLAVRVVGTGCLLGLHALGMRLLPFMSASLLWRELVGALALLPGGLLLGMFFPLGLARVHTGLVGRALLADALGTLATGALFFLVFLSFGRDAFLGVAVLAYLLAASVAWPRSGSGG